MKNKLVAAILAALGIPGAMTTATASGWDCVLTPAGDYRCHASGSTPRPETISPAPAVSSPAPLPIAPEPALTTETPPTPARIAQIDPAMAEPNRTWQQCAPIGELTAELPPADQQETNIAADQADIEQNEIYHLRGNAVIERASERIAADEIHYNQTSGDVELQGNVLIEKPALTVRGTQGQVNLDSDQGTLAEVDYRLLSRHARGNATMSYQDNADYRRFEQATYTTCNADNEVWRLDAKTVALDQAEGVGVARHAKLRVLDTPVFYTPYISFPIDDRRKSGILIPTWGRSEDEGTDISVPYYWNIAPNYDATLTPRWIEARGMQLATEFRFLQPRHKGQLDLEVLPSDDLFNDEDRILFGLEHDWRPAERLTTSIEFRDVSDADYFEDLGNNLGVTSETHIRRTGEVRYSEQSWNLLGRVQDFQTIDDTIPSSSRPYKRLPQIVHTLNPLWDYHGIEPSMTTELVYFDQDDRVTGSRLDMYPRLRRPFGTSGYFITPELGLRATHYSLNDTAAGDPSSIDRVLPLFSLDSGLFFDRGIQLFGNDYLNTLEPRAYYLYVPEEDQSDIPDFDTSLRGLTYQGMFSPNRFSGGDRIGDANQLTLAVSTRLLEPATGVQRARFTTGQIFYFRDREVTLGTLTPETDNSSAMIAQTELVISDQLSFDAGVEWDPYDAKTNLGNSRIKYQLTDEVIFNLSHRYRLNKLEQTDLSGVWQINPRWQLAGRWIYALDENSLLEGIAAVQYESCCWVLRLGASSFVNDNNTGDERDNAIMLQFELKGLTEFGDPISSMLEDGILGYPEKPY